jgi:glycosyltransferase involved in cell wall biosynthesis
MDAAIPLRTPKSLDYPLFQKIQTDFGFLVAFEKDHRRKPFDLIHLHYAVPMAHIMSNLRDIYRIPCILTFHGSDVTIVPDLMNVSMLSKLIKMSGARITVASRFLAEKASEIYELDSHDIHIIPNTISSEFFENYRRKPQPRPYFLHCSNLRPVKRVWDIILAMCCIKKRHDYAGIPQMPLLKIAGDGPDLLELRLLVKNNRLGGDVEFCGHVENRHEMALLMASAEALVLASFTESQPLVVLEAMAVGAPVVCSRFESAHELLGENNERGWSFDIGDSQQMAERLVYVLKNPEEAGRVAEAARQYVLQNHNSEVVVEAYEDLYAKTVAEG